MARSSKRKGRAGILSQTGSAGSGAPEPAAQTEFYCKLSPGVKRKVTEQLVRMRDTAAAVCVIAGDTNVKSADEMRRLLDQCLSTTWAMVENCIDGKDDFILTLGAPANASGHTDQFRRKFWAPLAPPQCHFLVEPLARFGAAPPEGEQHAPGELLQGTRRNRWICAWCARDDGPPTYCARCPLLMLQGGRFPGMSLVDPLRSKGTGKGRSPLAGQGPITRQVAEDLHRYADEQSRAAVGRASKGRGRSMHQEVRRHLGGK